MIADRPDCSLLTALQIFHDAEPGYYADPKSRRNDGIFDMLTRIHDRINAGGYKHDPEDHRRGWDFSEECYIGQQDGNTSRVTGYWQLDPRIVLPACDPPPRDPNEEPVLSEWQEARAQELFLDLSSDDQDKQRMAAMALVIVDRTIQWRVGKLMNNMPKAKKLTIGGILRGLLKR